MPLEHILINLYPEEKCMTDEDIKQAISLKNCYSDSIS